MRRPPTPLLKSKIKAVSRGHLSLPQTWSEFAPLTDIRSGEGIIKFNPYPYQSSLVQSIESNKLTIVGKSRQLGISETICNFFLFRACVDRGVLAVVLSIGQRETVDLAKRVRFALESLKPYGVKTTTDTVTDLQIENGGRILFRPSNENSTRGLPAVTHALIDEAAFVNNVDLLYQAMIPATSTVIDPKIILVSTPNGIDGFFLNMLSGGTVDIESKCNEIRNQDISPYQQWNENRTNRVLIHWRAHPYFGSETRYLERIAEETQMPSEKISQEYDLSFSDRNEAVFSSSLVRSCLIDPLPPLYNPNFKYYIGVDGSTQGSDYTVALVLEYNSSTKTYTIIDMYRQQKLSVDLDVYNICQLIDKYNPVSVGIETNGIGQIFSEQLNKEKGNSKLNGINVTQDNKIALIDRLYLALERKAILIPRKNPVDRELIGFKRIGKQLKASSGGHDDCVMALAFALSQTEFKASNSIFTFKPHV
jgi:hypothetical protein